jgi:phage major head subunit gpT-like protein
MPIITPQLLTSLRTGFQAVFADALRATPTDWEKIATRVPSSSSSNTYSWLGQFPALREWVGDRVLKDMAAQAYQVPNKLYEGTVSVRRTDIEDDNIGIYTPLVAEMGRAAAIHPDQLTFELLKSAHTVTCYDGQFFFDTDHPVYPNVDGTGTPVLVSNMAVGTPTEQTPWYLLDTSRALKPLLFQERSKPELESRTSVQDEMVFMADMYRYGVRYRCAAGLGLWQLAYRSTEALTQDSFNRAVRAMMEVKADGGRPLGVKPTVLVVPPALRAAAYEIVKAERLANGASNPNFGVVDLIVSPWLV